MAAFDFPSVLNSLVVDHDFETVTIGKSSAQVFRLRCNGEALLFLKCGEIGSGLKEEADRLKWLSGQVIVPSVVAFMVDKNREFLLMKALSGQDGTEVGREYPEAVVFGLAQQLRHWHLQPIKDCPFNQSLALQIPLARVNVQSGLVDENDFDAERRGCSAMELLEQLTWNHPKTEDLVLTHGDPCLPNVIFDGEECTGLVDCGRSGIADRYQDIALAARSISSNLGEQWVHPFFEHYGLLNVNRDKLAFYRLLDEFF
jgi:aminoglycoside 3'-phosphotransferase II